jgi:hypothetical protein
MVHTERLKAQQEIYLALGVLDNLEIRHSKQLAKATGRLAANMGASRTDVENGLQRARLSLMQALRNLQR